MVCLSTYCWLRSLFNETITLRSVNRNDVIANLKKNRKGRRRGGVRDSPKYHYAFNPVWDDL